MTLCCDSLSAPVPASTFAPVVVWNELLAQPFIEAPLLHPITPDKVSSLLETLGPPGIRYFTSVVLKRSTPSLAPPVIA
jgi:hypothetical protein